MSALLYCAICAFSIQPLTKIISSLIRSQQKTIGVALRDRMFLKLISLLQEDCLKAKKALVEGEALILCGGLLVDDVSYYKKRTFLYRKDGGHPPRRIFASLGETSFSAKDERVFVSLSHEGGSEVFGVFPLVQERSVS